MYFPFFILHDWGKRSAEARSSHLSGVALTQIPGQRCAARESFYIFSLILSIRAAYSSSVRYFLPGFMAKGAPHSNVSLYLEIFHSKIPFLFRISLS